MNEAPPSNAANDDPLDRELDRLLTAAYRDRDGSVGDLRPRMAEVTVLARRRQRRHRVRVGVLVLASVVVGAAGLSWSLRQPGADPQVETAISAPAVSPSSVHAPTTGDAGDPDPGTGTEWYGPVSDPDLTLWSALEVETTGTTPGARHVVELRATGTDDWRDQPAVAAVLIDRPASELVPRDGTPTTFGDRSGYRANYGNSGRVVFALDSSRSVRISERGLDATSLDKLATTVRVDGDRLVWPDGIPGGLHVLRAQPVTGSMFHVRTLTYTEPPDPAQRMLGTAKVAVRSTDDPVAVAESTTGLSGFDPGRVRRRDVAGRPAIQAGSEVQWRDGPRQFTLTAVTADPAATGLLDHLDDSVHALRPTEVSAIAVAHTTSSGPQTVNRQPAYPISPGATVRTDRFRSRLPTGFDAQGGDPLAEDGVLARAYSNDRWIDLSLAQTTAAPPTASAEPKVISDDGWSRTVLWHSPSGWSYELSASDKAGAAAPLSAQEMIALLRYVDTGAR